MFYKDQYQEFLNESLKVTFFDSQIKKTIKGLLGAVDDTGIKLEYKGATQQIAFSSIIQANLII